MQVDVSVEAGDWPESLYARAEDVAQYALARSGGHFFGPLEVSVLLTDDAQQQALNKQWRGMDKSTNVLSFPQFEPFADMSGLIGDISMAYETVAREAAELGKPLEEHFTHLLVHGVLHIVGYDHENEAEALEMEGLETLILGELGLADPYADAG